MRTPLSNDELLKIGNSLEDYHKIFYTFFNLAYVAIDSRIPTACVEFQKNQKPIMLLGREFWNGLTDKEKHFIICHECLHVVLSHDIRNGMNIFGATPHLSNIAQDITINEMIVNLFGFDRNDIRNWEKYCWIDTCFDDRVLVERNQTYDYYLRLLIEQNKEKLPELVDEHCQQSESGGPSDINSDDTESSNEVLNEIIDSLAEELAGELSKEEIEQIANSIPGGLKAGTGDSPLLKTFNKQSKPIKIDFSKIVKGLKRSKLKLFEEEIESFTRDDRRFESFLSNYKDLSLPSSFENEKQIKQKYSIALFMDVSGSCLDYLKQFEKVINSFKAEPNIFEVFVYVFATNVVKIEEKMTTYGAGGGTLFSIIENELLCLENEQKYPDGVVIITDGYGDHVVPKYPNRWIWLLTKGSTDSYIHRESKRFQLSKIAFEKVSI